VHRHGTSELTWPHDDVTAALTHLLESECLQSSDDIPT
jgi:hypothetical protein